MKTATFCYMIKSLTIAVKQKKTPEMTHASLTAQLSLQ